MILKDPGLRKVALSLYEHLNSPRALSCFLLLKYGSTPLDGDQLVTFTVDPRNYLDGCIGAEKFRRDAQATDFLRKSPLMLTSFDLLGQAEKTFHECEASCKETNEFLELLALRTQATNIPVCDEMRAILARARKMASRILGPVPDDLPGRFGPGTSAELKGSPYATAVDKLWLKPTATPSCLALFEHEFWRTHWGRTRLVESLPLPGVTRGNRFTTVAKDAKTLRGICIEPVGNLWVQLGIGGYLKRRLANVGLHVGKTSQPACPIERLRTAPARDGQSFHRDMARVGSLDGSWCTIDLSNASDTVALELVRNVIPPDWFDLLCAARSTHTLFKGAWHRNEKFSSMGNGFTFELESLLFAVIVAAAANLKVGESVFAYGDDLLVPEEAGLTAMAALKAFGFTPNVRKSYVTGPFRESCGGDFFSGVDVRSVFAKSSFETPLDWFSLHNALRGKWPSFGAVLHRIVQQIPVKLRKFGPSRLGDMVLHSSKWRSYPSKRSKWVRQVAVVLPILPRISLDRWGSQMHLTAVLIGAVRGGRGLPRGFVSPRGAPLGFRIRLASVS